MPLKVATTEEEFFAVGTVSMENWPPHPLVVGEVGAFVEVRARLVGEGTKADYAGEDFLLLHGATTTFSAKFLW